MKTNRAQWTKRVAIALSVMLMSFMLNSAPVRAEHPVFGALANGNTPSVQQQVTDNPALVTAKDALGRTLLHLAASRRQRDLVVFLVEHGADAKALDDSGATPLHAVLAGTADSRLAPSLEIVRLLLDKGADVNAADKGGRTPLYRATESGLTESVKLLRERGAKDNLRELFAAVQTSDRAAVEKLLAGDARSVNAADTQGFSPLHQAVRWHDKAMATLLLDKGADLNSRNVQGETPLALAITSRQLEMVRLLIERGAAINEKSEARPGVPYPTSPLMRAYQAGDSAIVSLLIDKSADLTASEPRSSSRIGDFLLAEAAAAGDLGLAKQLLDKGAKPVHIQLLKAPIRKGDLAMTTLLLDKGAPASGALPARGEEGQGSDTPLHWAARWRQKAIVELLLAHGADLKRVSYFGQTPLGEAVLSGDRSLVQLLLDKGAAKIESEAFARANPLSLALSNRDLVMLDLLVKGGLTHPEPVLNAVLHRDLAQTQTLVQAAAGAPAEPRRGTDTGITPLHVAALTGQTEIVAWLLEHGFPATLATRDGETPLHWAMFSGSAPTVRLLLDKGADVKARDRLQQTPLHLAASTANREIINLLLDKGAERDAALGSSYEPSWVKGTTPLLRAAWAGNSEAVADLLERGADANAGDEQGLTPLLAAAQARDAKSLALLLDKGAPLDQSDKTKRTALHYAIIGPPRAQNLSNHALLQKASLDDARPAIALLLERGAKPAVRDGQGRAALDLAVQSGDARLVTLLLDKGAAINAGLYALSPDFPSLEFPNEGYKMPAREGATALHQAVFNADRALVELLLARGADKNAEDAFGRTPLDIAERRGEITEPRGGILPLNVDFPFAPGHVAYRSNDFSEGDDNSRPPVLQTRKQQIAGILSAAGARHGKGPFMEAVRNGAIEVVRLMLKENPALARVRMGENNSTNGQGGFVREPSPTRGVTPLSVATQSGQTAVVALLLAQGATDIPSLGVPGALHQAARSGNVALARLLLDNGISVEARDSLRKTALHMAAASGSEEMVALLLERGADVNARDFAGMTPLNDARVNSNAPASANGSVSVTTRLPDGSIIQSANGGVASLLLAKGARSGRAYYSIIQQGDMAALTELLNAEPVLAKPQSGIRHSLLHMAVEQNKPEMVSLLAARGADLNALDADRRTPLHSAIAKGAADMIALLLDKGADINFDPDFGQPEIWGTKPGPNGQERVRILTRPALFAAISKGDKELVTLLLVRGAKPDLRDQEGVTPLKWAEQQQKPEIIELLKGPIPTTVPKPARFETPQQLEEALRPLLTALPSGPTSRALLPEPLMRAIKANQPESGNFLLALATDPQREGHRQALSAFLAEFPALTAEQITTYFKKAIQLKASLRPQYPEGFDVMARLEYAVRYGWDGFPQDFKLKTHTTHLIDGQPFGPIFDYQGPMAITGWIHTGKLARGEHLASLKMKFEWENNGLTGAGSVESEPFKFRIVRSDIHDDLIVQNSPEDEQTVKTAFIVSRDPNEADEGTPQVLWNDKAGKQYGMRCPEWKLERALPFALSFDVEIHEIGTEKVFKGQSVSVPAGQTRSGRFYPYIPQEFAAGHTGLVPVKIVLLPSYAMALSDPTIKSFFANPMAFDNLHIRIIQPKN